LARIVINNLQDLDRLQTKVKALKAIYPRLQNAATKDAASGVLDEIKTKMKQNNFSDKVIDATHLGKTEILSGFIKQHFISDYVSQNGFDVSNAREEGTTHPNPTFPKKPGGVLRWISKTGEIIFRKKSHPKGMERLLIIERTIKENQDTFANKVSDNLSKSMSKVLGV